MSKSSLLILFTLIIAVSGCKKEDDNIIWEKSFVQGKALYLRATPDSGLISCGQSSGSPYLILIDADKKTVFDYKADYQGVYSSAWSEEGIIIAAGSKNRKMHLSRLGNDGTIAWDTTFATDYFIDRASLSYLGNGEFFAAGSADPDSADSGGSGLSLVWFDASGTVSRIDQITETSYFIAAGEAEYDNAGNVYLAVTRQSAGSKTKASVLRYDIVQKKILWETELYNNPDFGAATLGIARANDGRLYVSGRTELSVSSGIADNTFVASLSSSGVLMWKKYLEYSNSGTSVIINESGEPVVLNKNCIIVNTINKDDGSTTGIIRTYRECDPATTDAYGYYLGTDFHGDLIMAGSRGGRFYIALKSILSLSPV